VLTELSTVRQIKGEPRRRWFKSASEDLIVWYAEDGSIFGFQLCYDRPVSENALTWLPQTGFTHNRIDDGENVGLAHKRTPALMTDSTLDARALSNKFEKISGHLPDKVTAFVFEKLRECADSASNA
jgi:hypothetical protein